MAVKGGKEVIAALNDVLTGELTAINQYFMHAKMCAHWGFGGLAAKLRAETIDEMMHADQLIDRILYLGGLPNLQRLGKLNIGETVPEQLRSDMGLEHEAIPRLRAAMKLCDAHDDDGTRAMLEAILVSEETHLAWIETQLSLIDAIGLQNYLADQIRGA